MARVTIHRDWPDGDCLTVEIRVSDSYPDVVREGVRAALDAYKEAVEISVAEPGE